MIVIVGNVFFDMYEEIVEVVLKEGVKFVCYYCFLGDFMKQYMSVVVIGVYGKIFIMGMLVYVI